MLFYVIVLLCYCVAIMLFYVIVWYLCYCGIYVIVLLSGVYVIVIVIAIE